MLIHAMIYMQEPALTGLESSVVNNEGYGIEPFRGMVSLRCCRLSRCCYVRQRSVTRGPVR